MKGAARARAVGRIEHSRKWWTMTSLEDRQDFDALLAHVPLPDRAKAELSAMMAQKARFYHGVGHLALLWRRHRLYAAAEGLNAPEIETLIACAIAYHDCVYQSGARDNEERSAEVWLRASAGSAISEADRIWVADTIRATADHLAYPAPAKGEADAERQWLSAPLRERARLWVLDLDLTPLGEIAAEFDRNTELLRLESPQVSDAQFEAGTRGFLKRFSDAPRVYRSPTLAAHFEAQARANFARELQGA
jgi:predicted metal-dependent HD superfamily phosphohydrolase